MPASISIRSTRRRWRGGAVTGSVRRQISASRVGIEKDVDVGARGRAP